MNSTGIVRRVDELGRVVIPVEIRRLLNIKEGESLEFIINNGAIELKKKSVLDNNYSFFNLLSSELASVVDGDYFITDREKIFQSSDLKLNGTEMNGVLINFLSTHDDSVLNNVDLFGNNAKSTYYIFPYYVENDIGGLIVIYNINSVEKYSKLIKFITCYIHDKLSL